MVISAFNDTHISASVDSDREGLMFTSIPYNSGWDVYVDGAKTKTRGFYDAFLAFEVKPGIHEIEFKYHSPGFGAGILITLVSIALFLIYLYLHKDKEKFQDIN